MRAAMLTAVAALASCGGSGGVEMPPVHDADIPDGESTPPPPLLGAQLDRAGRPGITTLLVDVLGTAGAAHTAILDNYNHASEPAMWELTTLAPSVSILTELEKNLALFDAVDNGMTSVPSAGCRNALRYSGPPKATSYETAARMLADDEIHVDTSKTTCAVYLALEIEYASQGQSPHSTCGGRTPIHDTVDLTYSVLAGGLGGLDLGNFTARLGDGVGAHGDVKDSFPFLGAPH